MVTNIQRFLAIDKKILVIFFTLWIRISRGLMTILSGKTEASASSQFTIDHTITCQKEGTRAISYSEIILVDP